MLQKRLCPLFAVLLLGAVSPFPTNSLFSPSPAMAAETSERILTVTGTGQQSLPTTQAQVSLGVEVQGQTAAEVQEQIARQSNAVIDYLRSQNVEKLETTSIRLNPQYDRRTNNQPQLIGYVGSNVVSFQVPVEATGEIIDGAIAQGATKVQNISFSAADEAIDNAKQSALEKAVADAQRKANTVLSVLDLGAQEIVFIQIDGAARPFPVSLPGRAAVTSFSADSAPPTPVVGGETSVSAQVTLHIRY
ncbi:MAG: SIMPL domain-containing protein [Cyanobacteria bacterium P01_H01_bin.15]